ncbi:uncharacterized protein BP01DRAFT_353898 [Aspergillus saccharolyticus JOP 1030-1]|uniref:Borealin N-terminal domain-containing protein n=1 Tax=Aspergillus saccharolyticus JOP 1030-1 TaxID=1450539 RepID=A0A318ZM45_9EURO|nr:hypothetical protein BP01DRAFT_353898 [Aspergillus saccharolyticus JOP 1030-1]PYH48007.1 hypothetical protein BP01DRAFT_353898 [Aspergillus saccharolyticus JOP 1030-1]
MASLASKRKSPEDASRIEEAITPTNSPPKKKLRITRNQKQALIDNLQLEITERARKLRAQYALQAHDLRARIERRINRIPIALRKANMGELLEKHMRAHQENTSPRKLLSPAKASRNFAAISISPKLHKASSSARRVRKQSHEGIYSDKENAPADGESLDVLKNPKRRAKPGAAAGTSRVVSQEMRGANDYRILSPKTSNSRTYPQSPLRASPEKSTNVTSYLSRPMSPLKPSSPLKGTSASMPGLRSVRGPAPSTSVVRPSSQAATRRPASRAATTTTSKTLRSPLPRPATRHADRRGSVSSSASSGTTVAVSKPILTTTTTTTGSKKSATSTSSTAARKTTGPRSQASATVAAKRNAASATATAKRATTAAGGEAAPTAGRRVLRKRA